MACPWSNRSGRARVVAAALLVCGIPRAEARGDAPPDPGPRGSLELSSRFGSAEYTEEVSLSPTDSDWEADTLGIRGRVGWRLNAGLRLAATAEGWISEETTERWTESGRLVQENDMFISGVRLQGEIGYPLLHGDRMQLTPALAGMASFQRYDRSDFVLIPEEERLAGGVTEDVRILAVGPAARLQVRLTPDVQLGGRLQYGAVVYSHADNSAFGEVDGDGGEILEGSIRLGWSPQTAHTFWIGAWFSDQSLDGGETTRESGIPFFPIVDIEWPENELQRAGLEFGWRVDW